MKKITLSFVALAAAAIMAQAQAPAKFNYQGIARNTAGAPLASRSLGMRITIHEGTAVGTIAYQETQTVTTNAFGLYNLTIGGGAPVTGTLSGVNWASGDKYIQVEMDPAGNSNYADLGSTQLLSVPFAMNAASATAPTLTLTGNTLTAGGNSVTLPTSSISGTQNYIPKFSTTSALGNSTIFESTQGKVGIGTTLPEGRVHISGSTDSTALFVTSSYNGSSPNKYALAVVNSGGTSGTGAPAGVYSEALPSTTSQSGRGVLAFGGNVGVHGIGYSDVTTPSASASTFGVYAAGFTNTDALGVYGIANANTVTGGAKYGVYGVALNGSVNYAGYFSGNVSVTGSISKGGGTFKIDHPLDPDNKYLYHSFVESPDMMNIYNGNVTTDAGGFATVTMPAYFDALNKDFRYQLTAIGTFAQAIVAEEMNGNTFRIQTSQPNVKVSWQVTGVREDAYANAHRVQPEVDKEAANRGRYLHPVELGKPATSEINYELNHPKMAKDNPELGRIRHKE